MIVLQQELAVPLPPVVGTEPLHPAQNLHDRPLYVQAADLQYCLPPDTSGQIRHPRRRHKPPATLANQLIPVAVPSTAASADLCAGISPQPDTQLSVPSLKVPVIGRFTEPETDLSAETVDVDPAVPRTNAWRCKRNAAMWITWTHKKEHYICKKCGPTQHSSHWSFTVQGVRILSK